MPLSYLTQLNVKEIAYDLHDERISVGTSGGLILQTSAYIGAETIDSKLVTQGELPVYSYASTTSTATAGMAPSISSAISNASEVFLRADGQWAKPIGWAAEVNAATSATIGGLKLGHQSATTDSGNAYEIAVELDGSAKGYVTIPLFSSENLTTTGYIQHGLVPRLGGVPSTSSSFYSRYHFTANGWKQFTVSGTTLVLDGV